MRCRASAKPLQSGNAAMNVQSSRSSLRSAPRFRKRGTVPDNEAAVITRIGEFLVKYPVPLGVVETPLTGAALTTLLAPNAGNTVTRFGRNGGMTGHWFLIRHCHPAIGRRRSGRRGGRGHWPMVPPFTAWKKMRIRILRQLHIPPIPQGAPIGLCVELDKKTDEVGRRSQETLILKRSTVGHVGTALSIRFTTSGTIGILLMIKPGNSAVIVVTILI